MKSTYELYGEIWYNILHNNILIVLQCQKSDSYASNWKEILPDFLTFIMDFVV